MAPRLVRIGIGTDDLEAAAAAWRNASGLEAKREDSAVAASSRIAVGDVILALTALAPGGREGLDELTLEVDDIEAMRDRLVASGARVVEEESGMDGSRTLRLDPGSTFGVPIVLVE